MKKSFDNKKYLKLQGDKILERVNQFDGKLYIEFGGKIFDDYHASRVFKGFEIDSKVKVLLSLKSKVEVVITVCATDIEKAKTRGDSGITYENETLRLYDQFEEIGLKVGSIVITQYNNHPSVDTFKKKLDNLGIKNYVHYPIDGYPYNVDYILSDEGFGKNEYIETERPIVIVTAPGPGSGKMATCLSQLYNENKRGIKAGYAKYETFPVWNLALKDPVNLAYEAATADLKDVNMIDYFHVEHYQQPATSYNRDLEVFPVLHKMFNKIYGESPYKSPTDMGVNMIGFCMTDEELTHEYAKQEIIRRYLDAKCAQKIGKLEQSSVDKIKSVMESLDITTEERKCVAVALEKEKLTGVPSVALELDNGVMITGKKSELFEATSAAIINAIKYLAKIPDDMPLLSFTIIEPIQNLKKNQFRRKVQRLYLDEVLITLSITGSTNAMAQRALEQLPKLSGCQMHSSVMLHPDDLAVLKSLNINVTTEINQDTKLLQR